MSVLEKVKSSATQNLYAGIAANVIYYFVGDSNLTDSVNVMDTEIPLFAVLTGSVFLGASIGEAIVQSNVLGSIPILKDYQSVENAYITPLTTGLSSALVMKGISGGNSDIKTMFLIGAGSDLLGKYTYRMM